MPEIRMNAAGLAILKESEGLRLQAYQDSGGVWTIGYGHILGVKAGDTCTEEEAEAFLQSDLERIEACMAKLLAPLTVSDNEWSGLADLCFNMGARVLKHDGIVWNALNRGDKEGAADAIKKWNKAHVNGQLVELKGLTIRRAKDAALFLKGD